MTRGRADWRTGHRCAGNAPKTVAVVISGSPADTSVLDALSLLATDPRMALFITTPFITTPPIADGPVFRQAGGILSAGWCQALPWPRAQRREFDLVLTSGVHRLSGKNTLLIRGSTGQAQADMVTHGLTVALSHESELGIMGSVPSATVVGDLCYDRLLASIPFRARYRRAFGVLRGQRLVVVMGEPPEFDRPPAGLCVLAAGEHWRPALVAADVVIGDDGPATRYAAAVGLPVLLNGRCAGDDEVGELLRARAPRLLPGHSLPEQIRDAMFSDRRWQDTVPELITSRPGWAADLLRQLMYRLVGLIEPQHPAPCLPVPLPCLPTAQRGA